MAILVEYPANVPEIPVDLSNTELIRRLKLLTKALQNLEQDSEANSKYKGLAQHIVASGFTSHQSREVRILVACCIADIFRMFAPDAPYGDPEQLKDILVFLIRQLRGLDNPQDPHYKLFYYLLENLTVVKSLNIGLELEDNQYILCQLIKHTLAIPNASTDSKVRTFLLDLLHSFMNEIESVSISALDTVFQALVEPYKTQNREAHSLARELLDRCQQNLEPYIQTFLTQALLGHSVPDSYVVQSNKIYSLIGELFEVEPKLLNAALGQLEYRLQTEDDKDRLDVVKLLGRLFAAPNSTLAEENPQLWTAFLGRFHDKKAEIRLFCVGKSQELLVSRPELRAQLSNALTVRLRDFDETVRQQTIQAVATAAKRCYSCINDSLFESLAERVRDKKFVVRREALLNLGTIYRKVTLGSDFTQSEKDSVGWIKDKLLHAYYQTQDDKLLCETLLTTCLVPYTLGTEDRMDILFRTYCTLDVNAYKCVDEIIKQQSQVRTIVRQILELHKEEENNERQSKINSLLKSLSEKFAESARAFECLKQFYAILCENNKALQIIEYIVGTNYSTPKINDNVKELLHRLNQQRCSHSIQQTVKTLLERSAPLLIDLDAVRALVSRVGEALESEDSVGGVAHEKVVERSFALLNVLASAYPYCFKDGQIYAKLLQFLRSGSQVAIETSIQLFSHVGFDLEHEFEDIFSELVPLLKTFATTGTARQAKYAVRCINEISSGKIELFKEIVDTVTPNASLSHESCVPSLSALGAIAVVAPDEFLPQFQKLVSGTLVPLVILNEEQMHSLEHGEKSWVPESELSPECAAKIAAMKFLVRFLCGLKRNESDMATSALKMFTAHIETKGDVRSSDQIPRAEMAHLRLAAACAMLKLMQVKEFSAVLKRQQFRTLAFVIMDSCAPVRQRFAVKLNKALLYGLTLSVDYISIFALAALLTPIDSLAVKEFKSNVKNCISVNIQRRRDFARKKPALQDKPQLCMPEYALAYAVYLLSYAPTFRNNKDTSSLRAIKEALWFMVELFVSKEQSLSMQFLYRLFQEIKQAKDADCPNDDVQNRKLWAVCDVGMVLVTYRVPGFVIRDVPAKPRLLSSFFITTKQLQDQGNTVLYLPSAIIDEEKRKYGKHPKPPKARLSSADEQSPSPKRQRRSSPAQSPSTSRTAAGAESPEPKKRVSQHRSPPKRAKAAPKRKSKAPPKKSTASPAKSKPEPKKVARTEPKVEPRRTRNTRASKPDPSPPPSPKRTRRTEPKVQSPKKSPTKVEPRRTRSTRHSSPPVQASPSASPKRPQTNRRGRPKKKV